MKVLLRYFIGMLIACTCIQLVHAQTPRIDSLKRELSKSPKDSTTVFLYNAIADGLYAYDTLQASEYQQKGYLLAKKMNWDYALGDNFQIKAMHKQFLGDHITAHLLFDSAILFFNKTINSSRPKQERENAVLATATSLGQKADILSKRGKSEESIAVYLATLEAWKASNEPRRNEAVAVYYTKISTIYSGMLQFEKALYYDKLSLATFLSINNQESAAWAYVYITADFIGLKQLDSATHYLLKAKPIIEQLKNHRLSVQYHNKMGQISSQKNNHRAAIGYFEQAIAEAGIANNRYQILSNQRMIGVSYVKLGDHSAARKYFSMALPEAIAGDYTKEKMEILQQLVIVEEKSNQIEKAYEYLKQVTELRDSVREEDSKKAVAEIENKYQAAEKGKEIIQLNADKQMHLLSIEQKSILNYFLIGLLAALVVVGLLSYRNIRHRQQLSRQQDELQQNHIRELEKDKKLIAVDSMLKGQEDERSRLAKDLHDSLGGLLSGVKYSLSNMKDNLIITPDNMAVFERSLDMIDMSIRELRRVAHNMMPEMLTKFGLDEALKEYCNTINATGLLSVKYLSIGLDTRLEKSSEIIIYRTIQELLNNIMKHAGAKEAIVQLIKEHGRLNIIVEDDGKGFDTALLENNKGAGLTSIQSRVDYLKGRLDIHSTAGKGTLVNIELNI